MTSPLKPDLLGIAAELARRGVAFVIATVVRREGESSTHRGDMAIVSADGEFFGWLGGGCTRPSVEREAALALVDATPRLICLTPRPDEPPRTGITILPMTCKSEGTVEIYLDPIVARPRLVLFGRSPIVRTLATIARAAGYRVDVADPDLRADEVPDADRTFTQLSAPELAEPGAYVGVATLGEHDEEALALALAQAPAYLGVVASRRRFAAIKDTVIARGFVAEQLAAVRNPAGLDLAAHTPEEVAVSLLAEIVATRNGARLVRVAEAGATAPVQLRKRAADEAIDPVCKMTVRTANATHLATWGGRTWYFCGAGCKQRFLADPERHASAEQVAR
jgi:xanthine dehydrogenase accessory factor